jgi:hypothetical protein
MLGQKGFSSPFKSRVACSMLCATAAIAIGLLLLPGQQQAAETQEQGAQAKAGAVDPYANNNGIPLPKGYTGPRYVLNHTYPQTPVAPPANPPWRMALGGKPIGPDNAVAYVNALKDYVAVDMKVLVNDYENGIQLQPTAMISRGSGRQTATRVGRVVKPFKDRIPAPGLRSNIMALPFRTM